MSMHMDIRIHVYYVYAFFRIKDAKETNIYLLSRVFLGYMHMYTCMMHLYIHRYEYTFACVLSVRFVSNEAR